MIHIWVLIKILVDCTLIVHEILCHPWGIKMTKVCISSVFYFSIKRWGNCQETETLCLLDLKLLCFPVSLTEHRMKKTLSVSVDFLHFFFSLSEELFKLRNGSWAPQIDSSLATLRVSRRELFFWWFQCIYKSECCSIKLWWWDNAVFFFFFLRK